MNNVFWSSQVEPQPLHGTVVGGLWAMPLREKRQTRILGKDGKEAENQNAVKDVANSTGWGSFSRRRCVEEKEIAEDETWSGVAVNDSTRLQTTQFIGAKNKKYGFIID